VPPPPVSRRGEDIITNFVSFGEKSLDNQKIGETYIMQIAITELLDHTSALRAKGNKV